MARPHNPNYVPWRQGQRRARRIVSRYFQLEPANVIHHEDSDNRNNELSNLAVFRDQSDHLAYHHGANVAPLWRGSNLVGISDPDAHRCEFVDFACKHCGSRPASRAIYAHP